MKCYIPSRSAMLKRVYAVVAGILSPYAIAAQPTLTHGVVLGDLTSTSAILWTRANTSATLIVELAESPDFKGSRRFEASAAATNDFTAQLPLPDLEPATLYHYRVTAKTRTASSSPVVGSFETAPSKNDQVPVSFIVGGDVGGQGYCRHVDKGYEIFQPMAELEPDFFVANGDMIYADGSCPAVGPGGWRNVPGDFPSVDAAEVDWTHSSRLAEIFFAHWRYNRADAHHQSFFATVPIYAQWDDHEVINDFGVPWESLPPQEARRGYPNLVQIGRDAFFAWNPITRHPAEEHRIYRSFRWGRDVELFLLDARSYRSPNELPTRPGAPKSLLGEAQLDWLIAGLEASDATWKIVSSDVPLSIPTGSQADLYGRDAFANGDHPWEATGFAARTGFEDELRRLLGALDTANVENLVVVATDIHYATHLRYQIDIDGDGDELVFHELLSGPLNAVSTPIPHRLDPTFRPVTLFAEAGVFNFSYLSIERRGGKVVLNADIRGADGKVRVGSALELVASPPGRTAE